MDGVWPPSYTALAPQRLQAVRARRASETDSATTRDQETNVIQTYQLHVDGRRVDPVQGRMLQTTNPYTGEVWAEIPDADREDVALAVAAANTAFQNHWRHTPGLKRAALMLKLAGLIEKDADRLSRIESTDNGKIVRETRPQMLWVGRQLRYFAGYADKLFGQQVPVDQPDTPDYFSLEPFGVVGRNTHDDERP